MAKRNRLRSPLFLLAIVLLAPFLPILLAPGGRVLGSAGGDGLSFFYYVNEFAGRCWRQGIIPLWNPHIMLGMPFLGEGQAAIFHPLSSLFAFLPPGVAINWLIALSFLLTGLAFYGYLRAVGLGTAAAGCGALAWSFSSVPIARIYAGHLTILLVFIEMPLLPLFWERYRQHRKVKYLFGIALAYGLMILAFSPLVLYIFSLFFLFYVLVQALAGCTSRGAAWREARGVLALGVFILLGIAIGAVQLLPSADFAAQSFRSQASLEFCGSYSFPPENLLTLLVPRFLGYAAEPGAGQYWGRDNFWEMACYIGILPLLLVPLGLRAAPRRQRLALGGGALLFLILALGRFTPLFPYLYRYVPLFNIFRGPARNMIVTQFCLVTLAAYGIENLLQPARTPVARWRFLAPLALAAVALATLAAAYAWLIPGYDAPGSHWQSLLTRMSRLAAGGAAPAPLTAEQIGQTARWAAHEMSRAILFLLLGAGLIALAGQERWRPRLPWLAGGLILADLLGLFLPMLVTFDEALTRAPDDRFAPFAHSPYPARVLDPSSTENIAIHYGLASPSGYSGNTLERYNRFVSLAQGLSPAIPQAHNQIKHYKPLIRYLAPDAIFLPQGALKPGMSVLAQGEGWVWVRPAEALPRVFLAAAPRRAATEDEALRYVLDPAAPLGEKPVIERRETFTAEAAPLAPGEGVRIAAFTPNRVELDVRAARPRVLVLCEMFEKNWRARIGDTTIPISPANVIFRAVEVPAGRARVVFEYRPRPFLIGVTISGVALALVLGMGLVCLMIRTRKDNHINFANKNLTPLAKKL